MNQVINRKYHYKGYYGCDAVCGLTIVNNTIIATELDENQGTSITNMAENLAMEICKEYKILPEKLIWIERYPRNSVHRETYDLVTFSFENDKFCHPAWKNLSSQQFEEIRDNAFEGIKS